MESEKLSLLLMSKNFRMESRSTEIRFSEVSSKTTSVSNVIKSASSFTMSKD